MKRILSLCLLLGISQIILSQEVIIKDKEYKEPLDLVTLVSNNPKAFALTNREGKANISGFEGANVIEIRKLGYKTTTLSYSELKKDSFQVLLEKANLNLDEAVVSATRWRQTSGRIPSKITTVSADQIDIQNPQTAADLLGVSGEVYVQKSQQGGGSPMIRGFATNRLLYTVDGVRMNTAIFRGGNLQNVISLDPFATENTEILFGPGSVIYGSDAIGGVMSFQTLTPQLSTSEKPLITGKANTRYSSANSEITNHFDVNIGWKKWAIVTSISSFDFGHVRQGSHGPEDYIKSYHVQRIDSTDRMVHQDDPLLQKPSAYSQKNIMQKVRFKPNHNWDFEYGFHYSETSDYGRYDRHNRTRNGQPRYGKWDYGPQVWSMNNLKINHLNMNTIYDEMTIRLAHQYFEESRIDRDFNDPLERNRIEKIDAYSVNLDLTKSLSSDHKLFYGAEVVRNEVRSNAYNEHIYSGSKASILSRYPQADWSSYGIYLKDQLSLSDQFILQGGLRYNQYVINADFDTTYLKVPFTEANINNGSLTGSIGISYRPNEEWILKANASTGFRSPNVDDIGKVFDSEPGSVVVPNPDLQAEYAYNIDAGIAKVFDDFIKLNFTTYYTILENAMVRRNYQLNGQDSIVYDGTMSQVQALQNAAKATRYGVQFGLEMKLPGNFSLSSKLNFQDGEDEMDDGSKSPPRHAAPVFGVSRLSYDFKDLNLQFYSMYQGERTHEELALSERDKTEIYALDENGNTFAPSWYTLNIKALYQITDTFTISAGLENLLDKRYRPYSSGISAPGRNFFISVKANF
ncbi:MAG: TonB-dependent receptor [Bacteroidales bacterium]|nr:TonB-dependent receptor [Bacteroidales bacterium]